MHKEHADDRGNGERKTEEILTMNTLIEKQRNSQSTRQL